MVLKAKTAPPGTADILTKGRWILTGNNLAVTDTAVNYTSTVIRTGAFLYDNTRNVLTNGTWQNVTEDAGQLYSGTFPTM